MDGVDDKWNPCDTIVNCPRRNSHAVLTSEHTISAVFKLIHFQKHDPGSFTRLTLVFSRLPRIEFLEDCWLSYLGR